MLESSKPHPEDPYGISKYAVELDLECAKSSFQLPYTIFRPHNVYGEYQNIGDRYRNVIGIFMNQIMLGLPMSIFGDGTQTRAFSYVRDVVTPMIDCLMDPKTNGEVFNVGADQPYTVNELAQVVSEAFGVKPNIQYFDARAEVLHAYSDHAKIKSFFQNLEKPLSLVEGISKMASWARQQGPRKTNLFMGIELWKNMPPAWEKEFRK
jgi:UDP-glucose 4-epimerase